MPKDTSPILFTRRRFLQTAGAALAASTIAGAWPAATGHAGRAVPLKIGVMVPRSTIHPTMAENWLGGLELFFSTVRDQAGGRPLVPVVEEIGVGVSPVRRAAQRFLEDERADLVVGLLNTDVAIHVRGLFEEAHVPFIVNAVGANIVPASAYSPYLFYNSLSYWQANWMMGRRLVEQGRRRLFVASSLFDSGYDTLYAFRHAVESAGGSVIDSYVSGVIPGFDDEGAILSKIRETRPDAVYAFFSGASALRFVSRYGESGLAARIPLYGAAFLVDETLLPAHAGAARDVESCLSWTAAIESAENGAFVSAFERATGRPTDSFAVLGYDTGRLVAEALHGSGGHMGDAFVSALERVRFEGPRGPLRVDPATHHVTTPLYVRQVQRQQNRWQNVALGELVPAASPKIELSGPKSGWLNPYLCL